MKRSIFYIFCLLLCCYFPSNADNLTPDLLISENSEINNIDCEAEGGDLSTDDPTEICPGDGNPNTIDVTLTGNVGSNSIWAITDNEFTILAFPSGLSLIHI